MLNNMNIHIVHGAELKDAENREVTGNSMCKEVYTLQYNFISLQSLDTVTSKPRKYSVTNKLQPCVTLNFLNSATCCMSIKAVVVVSPQLNETDMLENN